MKTTITLTKTQGFALMKPQWDGGGSHFVGYFKDKNIAISLADKEGGYNPSSNVSEVDDLYTDGEKIYIVKLAGKGTFSDEEKEARDKVIDNIKSKLTPAELTLLGIK